MGFEIDQMTVVNAILKNISISNELKDNLINALLIDPKTSKEVKDGLNNVSSLSNQTKNDNDSKDKMVSNTVVSNVLDLSTAEILVKSSNKRT